MTSCDRNGKQYVQFYFQVHQPRRLNPVHFFDLPHKLDYFNDDLNREIIQRVAAECYLPANRLLMDLIRQHPRIRITFSLSGVLMEQLEQWAPDAIKSFRLLAQSGAVEFLSETYYHSLAGVVSGEEFEIQVLQHADKTLELFGVRPTVFRNTELIYDDSIGSRVAGMGFKGIITEGHESAIGDRSPHVLYAHPTAPSFCIFLRNYRLSDDIGFRFIQDGRRLTAAQYMDWLSAMPENEELITIGIDYETFGEHQKHASGIFDFLQELLVRIDSHEKFMMVTPSEALQHCEATTMLSLPRTISWADMERDISAWLGNDMQKDAFQSVMKLENEMKCIEDEELLRYWRYLQTSDHFYYMSLKTDNDGSVHSYFSPFPSSYEAFINYMNVLTHINMQLNQTRQKRLADKDRRSAEGSNTDTRALSPVLDRDFEDLSNVHTSVK